MSAFRGSKLLLFSLMTRPTVENTLSAGTDVAGMQRYFRHKRKVMAIVDHQCKYLSLCVKGCSLKYLSSSSSHLSFCVSVSANKNSIAVSHFSSVVPWLSSTCSSVSGHSSTIFSLTELLKTSTGGNEDQSLLLSQLVCQKSLKYLV